MRLNRRRFLFALAALSWVKPSQGAFSQAHLYYSARADFDGRYYVTAFDQEGKQHFKTLLPERGHAIIVNPKLKHLAAVARRPGTYLTVVDARSGEELYEVESQFNQHFYGHGVYTADGRWLLTSENNIETGQGIIVIRDALQAYKAVRHFPSYGIEPHEIRLLSDGKTLVVANGGILTRPETGRRKLNIETMSPSLAYIDINSGQLLEQHVLPAHLHKNSIRHLDVCVDDQVCFAMQYQGAANTLPPLIGLHRRGENIQLLNAPPAVQQQMRNYCGSAVVERSGRWFAVSAPKGDIVTIWSTDGQYITHVDITDGCGLAPGEHAGEFILSSGAGGVFNYSLTTKQLKPLTEVAKLQTRWDNHISI